MNYKNNTDYKVQQISRRGYTLEVKAVPKVTLSRPLDIPSLEAVLKKGVPRGKDYKLLKILCKHLRQKTGSLN